MALIYVHFEYRKESQTDLIREIVNRYIDEKKLLLERPQSQSKNILSFAPKRHLRSHEIGRTYLLSTESHYSGCGRTSLLYRLSKVVSTNSVRHIPSPCPRTTLFLLPIIEDTVCTKAGPE
ncbi:hypothetical protein TcWFU_003164 [Taenia crassiceps]|uniref:Uncharacterized protein n=1 Tax=Taenia crassiceps TaxID=6207 RepID=A0ABR4QAX7_9CEST